MQRIVTTILSAMLPILAAGQAVSVIDFMPVAADASTVCEARSLTDASGSPCSVVKILTDYTDWTFEAGLAGIVDVRTENDAICLYIPATARILSFSHPKYGAVRDWTIPQTLLPGYCYSLRLEIRQTPEHAAAGLPDRIPTPGPVPKPVSATTHRVKPELSTRSRRGSQCSDHFIDFTGGVSLSKCRRDDGYCNMQTEWEASEYWFGMTYAWVGKKVGPYLSLSLSDFSSFAGLIGVNWRMTDPHSDTMDWQLHGGLGLAGGCFAVDGGMRFGWFSSALVSKWDFGVGLHYHKGAITPTINFGFYIWGIPVIVGVGLVCHALL